MSAGNFLEAAIVVDSARDPVASRRLDELIALFGIVIEPVMLDEALIGRAAYRDFGKASGHPAQLNYGDCFAYALAKVTAEPLLFIGSDFSQTDLRQAERMDVEEPKPDESEDS
jgi:ribonuclease VapC